MASMAVDTLFLSRDLKAAEIPPIQAEAIAAAIGRSISEGAATKADVQLVRSDLGQFKAELETKIEQLRATLTTWFVGTILTLGAVIIAAVKL